jgi:lambda family phage portal protein
LSTAPRITGSDTRGLPKVRANAEGFSGMVESFRNMGQGEVGDLTFMPSLSSAYLETTRNRPRGLRNSRDAERNTEMVRGGLDRKANATVGPNLRPNPLPDIVWLGQSVDWALEFQQSASSVFQEWSTDILCRNDAEGHYHFGGLMWEAFRMLTGPDSEVAGFIGYDRDRADRLGTKWATYVSLFDPDRLSNPGNAADGNAVLMPDGQRRARMRQGREVDEHGAMIGMTVGVRHPSETDTEPFRWEYIPRATDWGRPMGFHWFFKRRPGLQRALTTLAAVLSSISMLSQFSKATLQSAVSHAYLAAYLKTTMTPEQAHDHLAPVENDPLGRTEWEIKANTYNDMNLRFNGKRIPVLGPNDEIKFESMAGTAMDFDPFRNSFLRELASALNVSFEQLSLDFSRVSYSSARQSMITAWANVTFERTMFTNHVASLIYDAVIEEAFALDILRVPAGAPDFYEARQAYTRCSWTGPAMGWVDPLKEIDAARGRMASGVSTLASEATLQGGTWWENILQASIERKFAEQHGVELDFGTGDVGDRASDQADQRAAQEAGADQSDNQGGE